MEQMRDFDFVSFEHDILVALGGLASDVASGLPYAVLGGLVGTQTVAPSLSINISAGRIYQFAVSDTIATGSIPQDLSIIVQQGFNPAQTLTLAAPSSGQSQWNLVQAQFSQVDAVRAGDPNGGIVPFYNAANPTQPTLNSINTVRKGLCVLQVITGSAATTGSEVPPNPTNGWVPLYIIDLAGGQTQITTSQIIASGPSVGTGVSSSYPAAPFLAGLLASHHNGRAGQAPQIKLGSEVQGILPYANMSAVRTLLNASLTLYVNNATGADTNSGLTPSIPFKTIQAAINAVYHNYDFNGFGCSISVANGSYSATLGSNQWLVTISGTPLGMPAGSLSLTGNVASPGSVTLSATNGNAILVQLGCLLNIQGFTITASGSNGGLNTQTGFGVLSNNAWINISNCVIGACGQYQLSGENGGILTTNGQPMTLTGATQASLVDVTGGLVYINGSTITVTGLSTTIGFAFVTQSGTISAVGNTFIGTATGPKYNVGPSSTISVNGGGINYFPGNSAGTVSANGFYG